MQRVLFSILGGLVLMAGAVVLTETTFALANRGRVEAPAPSPSPVVTPTPSPTASVTPIITPEPTPVATPLAAPTATTNSFVRLRAGASTSTAILAELDGGTVVVLGTYSDAAWQQVTWNGINGYIYRSYLNY